MAESSPLQSADEQQLLQVRTSRAKRPFEPTDVPLKSAVPPAPAPAPATSAASAPVDSAAPDPAAEEDPWKAEFEAQVEEWRAQSAEAREKAEQERAKWEAIRLHEAEERKALGVEPENWDALGSHIIASFASASEALSGSSRVHDGQHAKAESGSPSQKWENISSSPTSSYPSMSFPDPSAPQSPSPQQTKTATVPPSTLPSIMDRTVAPRTRMSLVLSSLAINLLLPFVNGVMLGFGEIFAKNVLVGWIGWKTQNGRTAAKVGLR
ncbi:hypothetical protein HYDPIDRAFT_174330 [Hydnomerulius pinastri MD-312]|nr:hypothetical protein HYDPIDRAFT_174330 [Hydnomerulius pinastri MD-312]